MDKRVKALLALHKPECVADPMVYEVWEDGEITLTKGGDLYRRRTLHCINPGVKTRAINPDQFPEECQGWNHARIVVPDKEAAEAARRIILGS